MGLLETSYSTKLAPYSQGRTRSTYVIPGVCLFNYYLTNKQKTFNFDPLLCILPTVWKTDNFPHAGAFYSA